MKFYESSTTVKLTYSKVWGHARDYFIISEVYYNQNMDVVKNNY